MRIFALQQLTNNENTIFSCRMDRRNTGAVLKCFSINIIMKYLCNILLKRYSGANVFRQRRDIFRRVRFSVALHATSKTFFMHKKFCHLTQNIQRCNMRCRPNKVYRSTSTYSVRSRAFASSDLSLKIGIAAATTAHNL